MRRPKAGEKVWLRDDLVVGVKYGTLTFIEIMNKGILVTVSHIEYDDFKTKECLFWYNFEMIDWEKTDKMNNGIVMPKFFDNWVKRQWSGSDLIINLIDDARKGELCEGMQLMFYFDRDKLYCALLDGYVVEGEVE